MHAHSCPTLFNPMDSSLPGFSVHGISRQEYWSRLPCPPPGDFPDPGINLHLLDLRHWQVDSLPLAPPGKPDTPNWKLNNQGSSPGFALMNCVTLARPSLWVCFPICELGIMPNLRTGCKTQMTATQKIGAL